MANFAGPALIEPHNPEAPIRASARDRSDHSYSLLGIYGDLGALIIAATLVPISIFMHAFWKESDAQAKMTEQVAFNKNVALIGGALAFFVFFAATSPTLTITGPLFTV